MFRVYHPPSRIVKCNFEQIANKLYDKINLIGRSGEMNMLISPEAAAWFKRELSLQNGAYVRLFPGIAQGADCIPDSRWE